MRFDVDIRNEIVELASKPTPARLLRKSNKTMWPSKWTKSADELLKLLDHWDGAKGEVWEYSANQQQLLVRFFRERPNSHSSMFLLCKDCRIVHFQTYWLDMQVRVSLKSDSQPRAYVVSDGERLRIECAEVFAAESDVLIRLPDKLK